MLTLVFIAWLVINGPYVQPLRLDIIGWSKVEGVVRSKGYHCSFLTKLLQFVIIVVKQPRRTISTLRDSVTADLFLRDKGAI